MKDVAVMVFGVLVLAAGIGLGLWERRACQHAERNDWLISARRHRRRMLVAAVIAVIGVLLVFLSGGVIPTAGRPGLLLVFLGGIMALCMLLLLLAFLDAAETARRATEHSMKELDKTLTDHRVLRALAEQGEKEDRAREGR